jgi:Spy/CpxP family protein refolding chaperone
MKRISKIGIGLAALAAVALFGAHAWARHHGGPHMFKTLVTAHIDEALEAAKATPPQKDAIHAAVDHVFAALKEGHQDRAAEMEQALSLFQADKLDPKAVAAHRAGREAEMKKVGDAIVQAAYDAHDTLTAEQRRAVADYVRANRPDKNRFGGVKERFINKMVEERTNAALDAISATPAQRTLVAAARDRVLSAMKDTHADHGAQMEKLLALFTADKVDSAQVEALRAEHLAKMHKVGDAVVGALSDVHDALSASQRKALVDFVRTNHPHHG